MGGTWSNETADNFTDIAKQEQKQPELVDVPSDESRDNPSEKKKNKETKQLQVRVRCRWWCCTLYTHVVCRHGVTVVNQLHLVSNLEWYKQHTSALKTHTHTCFSPLSEYSRLEFVLHCAHTHHTHLRCHTHTHTSHALPHATHNTIIDVHFCRTNFKQIWKEYKA